MALPNTVNLFLRTKYFIKNQVIPHVTKLLTATLWVKI
jgi:hypothetical protein